MLRFGKLLTAGFWLIWLANFVHAFPHPLNWILGGLGFLMLLMHGFELLIFRSLPAVKAQFRAGDGWKVMVFGAFQLWELKRRMESPPR
ncbi:MAG: DUF1145 domain-containing protein [Gammaproteobacteria bacterium]|nr:DUF1145 domain-containing protein [Gammaproteobacteria bacterium]